MASRISPRLESRIPSAKVDDWMVRYLSTTRKIDAEFKVKGWGRWKMGECRFVFTSLMADWRQIRIMVGTGCKRGRGIKWSVFGVTNLPCIESNRSLRCLSFRPASRPTQLPTKEWLIRHSPLQNTKNSALWFIGSSYQSDHRFSLAKMPDLATENTRSWDNDQW